MAKVEIRNYFVSKVGDNEYEESTEGLCPCTEYTNDDNPSNITTERVITIHKTDSLFTDVISARHIHQINGSTGWITTKIEKSSNATKGTYVVSDFALANASNGTSYTVDNVGDPVDETEAVGHTERLNNGESFNPPQFDEFIKDGYSKELAFLKQVYAGMLEHMRKTGKRKFDIQ